MNRLILYLKSVFALPEGKNASPLEVAIHTGYLLLFFLLPFSVPVGVGSSEIEVPSEPLIIALSLLLGVGFWKNGGFSRRFYRTPLSVAAVAWLGWLVLMVPFSSSPVTSAKYVVVACAHAWVFYHGAAIFFQELPGGFYRLWQAYLISFGVIICYAWTVHAQYGFHPEASVLTARPFYFDHALYSSAMLLLAGVYFVQALSRGGVQAGWPRWVHAGISLFLFAGVFLGFSRGAWLSLAGAGGITLLVALFRPRFRVLATGMVIGGLLITGAGAWYVKQHPLPDSVIHSGTSSVTAFAQHIIHDVSTLERVNRYSCAVRMFLDRPWTGFGPGTYQVAYLPYQLAPEMTRISVNHAGPHPPGRGGGAHSEYLQALSETGVPGALAWLALVIAAVWTAVTCFRRQPDAGKRLLGLGLLFGLLTFFLHGWLNNFLHSGKLAALFWAALAALNLLYLDTTGGSGGAPREGLPPD